MPNYQNQNWQQNNNRWDFGGYGGNFTAPVSDDDRGGHHHHEENPYSFHENSYQGGYGAYGGYGSYGGYDPYGYGSYGGYSPYMDPGLLGTESPFLAEGEQWGEVDQTSLEDLQEMGALQEYGPDAVLMIINGPEDLKRLNQEQEAANVAGAVGDRQTVVLWNPSPEAMEAMLKTGGFQDVVISGHGDQGVLYMTDEEGKAVAMDADTVAEMFEDTGVQNVFVNACHGAGGEGSVAQALSDIGINAMGWVDTVKDSEAGSTAGEWAALTNDGSDVSDFETVAEGESNLAVAEGEEETPTTPVISPFGPQLPVEKPLVTPPTGVTQSPAAVAAEPDYAPYLKWNSMNYMWM